MTHDAGEPPAREALLPRADDGGSAAATRPIIARDPRDLSRLLWYLVIVGLGLLAARGGEQTTAGFEADVVQLASRLPTALVVVVVITVQIIFLLVLLGIPVVLAATRQWWRLGVYALGWVATGLAMAAADRWITVNETLEMPDYGLSLQTVSAWPPSQSVANTVCALALLSPYIARRWRHVGWGFVAILAVLRVVTSETVALDVLLAVGIGGVVGTSLTLAFGRRVALPTAATVNRALSRCGLSASAVVPTGSPSSGPMHFRAALSDGRTAHCTVITAGRHEADSLRRSLRRVRVREVGEDVAFSSVRRAAAVQVMLALGAARAGARTPDILGFAPLGSDDEMVIAAEEVAGRSLAKLDASEITDSILDQAWGAVRALNDAGIAHRDLQASNWLLDEQGQLWVIDFSFGEPAATDGALSADIAELLAATYPKVGAERAVAAAVRGLGAPTLATGISHLVPAALTRRTRAEVKAQTDGLEPLVAAAAAACGIEEPQFAPIERVKPRTLVMAGMFAVAVYVLLPQLADLPGMIEAIRESDPRFAAGAALASVVTYIGSGMALSGACPAALRVGPAIGAAVAATFVSALAPPGVAQAGLNVRLYQKQGLAPAVAVSGMAAKEMAVFIVHMSLLLLLGLLAGSSGALQEELDRLPSLEVVAIVVAVVIAVVAVAVAIPQIRAFVRSIVVPALHESVTSLRELAANPAKMIVLFLGTMLLQLGFITALFFAARALGGDVGFVTIGLIYLTVGSVASVAPTPGGVGAVEAVLLAALVGVGMASSPALAAVFLFRLVTFWVPIPIGGLSFRMLAARDLL